LWFVLRDRKFAKFKFRRQVPIGRFIADFVCFERRLVIEVDGGQHADSVSDRRRDRWFAANGYRVLRFWNNEVMRNLDGVATLLAETLDLKDWP
jgi:very-short-patch-repair endonuclease